MRRTAVQPAYFQEVIKMVSYQESKRTLKEQTKGKTLSPESIEQFQERSEILMQRLGNLVSLALERDKRYSKVMPHHVDIAFADLILGRYQ